MNCQVMMGFLSQCLEVMFLFLGNISEVSWVFKILTSVFSRRFSGYSWHGVISVLVAGQLGVE